MFVASGRSLLPRFQKWPGRSLLEATLKAGKKIKLQLYEKWLKFKWGIYFLSWFIVFSMCCAAVALLTTHAWKKKIRKLCNILKS